MTRDSKNLVSKASEDAGFMIKISPGESFMTIHDMDLTGFGYAESCREYTSSRSDKRSIPKGLIRGNTKVGSEMEVKVTNHLEHHGIEIMIDSMQNDGSQSWIVISRRMDKCVNELPEETGKSCHFELVTPGAGRPLATKQKEQPTPPLSSLSTIVVPIDQRKWKVIPAVDYVEKDPCP